MCGALVHFLSSNETQLSIHINAHGGLFSSPSPFTIAKAANWRHSHRIRKLFETGEDKSRAETRTPEHARSKTLKKYIYF
jgi:hypothetical protein